MQLKTAEHGNKGIQNTTQDKLEQTIEKKDALIEKYEFQLQQTEKYMDHNNQ